MRCGNCFFNQYNVVKINCRGSIMMRVTEEEKIMMIVANTCNVSVRGMRAEYRSNREVTEAKFIAIAIIWKLRQPITKITKRDLGKLFRRDHSNVIYALSTAQDWYDTDLKFRNKMDKCMVAVKNVIYEAA